MVPKSSSQRKETSKEARRGGDEGQGWPRVITARSVTSRYHVTSSADDERHDASSPLPPGRAAGSARVPGARGASGVSAVTAPTALGRRFVNSEVFGQWF